MLRAKPSRLCAHAHLGCFTIISLHYSAHDQGRALTEEHPRKPGPLQLLWGQVRTPQYLSLAGTTVLTLQVSAFSLAPECSQPDPDHRHPLQFAHLV